MAPRKTRDTGDQSPHTSKRKGKTEHSAKSKDTNSTENKTNQSDNHDNSDTKIEKSSTNLDSGDIDRHGISSSDVDDVINNDVTVPDEDVAVRGDLDPNIVDHLSPKQVVEEALKEQKLTQIQAFHQLIEENVKLERTLRRNEELRDEQITKWQIKCVELEAEKGRSALLERDLESANADYVSLKDEMTKTKADKSTTKQTHETNKQQENIERGSKGKGKLNNKEKGNTNISKASRNSICENDKMDNGTSENIQMDENEDKITINPWKLRDLESRLLRLTEEDERKSRRIISIERELDDKTSYIEQLEGHVDKDVLDDLAKQIETGNDADALCVTHRDNFVYAGKTDTYSYRNNVVKDSTVCTVS